MNDSSSYYETVTSLWSGNVVRALLFGVLVVFVVAPAVAYGEDLSYGGAVWDPIHFKPQIDTATNEQCLSCHQEIMERRVKATSPAGVRAEEALAWYQTLDTYEGEQETFHRRHLVGPMARDLMNLKCNMCHQGHDPREEAPSPPTLDTGDFALRKVVDPAETCLLCHGRFPYAVMELDGPWHEVRVDLEDEETTNGCLVCHQELFRTNRHKVNYLNAEAIEEAAKDSSDVCYGCHGGRAWYAISYPYPRHPWLDMPEETPDWAKDRPTESLGRFLVGTE